MTSPRLMTVSFILAVLLLSSSVQAEIDNTNIVESDEQLKSLLSRQVCRACPSRCLNRRRARQFCGVACAVSRGCRAVRDPSCPRRRRGFRCLPTTATTPPTPTPTSCPNICRPNLQVAIDDCTPAIFRILGCVVRNCAFSGSASGFICALPVTASVTVTTPPSTTAAVVTTAAMTTAASTAPATTAVTPTPTATPSLTPTPSPSCQLTMQGAITQVGISGVCTCGTSTSTVILLQATGGISQACLNACYDDLLEDICVPNTFFRFATLGSGVVSSCCTTVCEGVTIPEFNQCGDP